MSVDEPGLRERKKAKTHQLLREKAAELFEAKGYEATTVAEIAAAADVSEPTFFRYYRSKAAVATAPVAEMVELMLAAIEAQPSDLLPIDAALAVATASDATSFQPPPEMPNQMRSLLVEPVAAGVLQIFDASRDRLARDFARRLGVDPSEAIAYQTAGAVLATVLGGGRAWVLRPDEVDPTQAVVDGLRQLKAGLR